MQSSLHYNWSTYLQRIQDYSDLYGHSVCQYMVRTMVCPLYHVCNKMYWTLCHIQTKPDSGDP